MAERQISEAELLGRVIDERMREVHVAIPGRVQTFEPSSITADIVPQVWPDGEELPVLPAVPVVFQKASGGGFLFSLSSGDPGLLIFAEVDLSQWRQQGQPGAPADLGRHNLQSAVFLPGLISRGEEESIPTSGAVIRSSALQLGGVAATDHVIRGEDYNTAILAWAGAVSAAITALGGDVTGALSSLTTALPLTLSSKVTTE
jgi:hypothetical protein